MKVFKKIIRGVLIAACAVLLFAVALVFVFPYIEAPADICPMEFTKTLMAAVPDDTPISELTVVGTHDSGANFVQLPYFAKCQSETVAEQLEDGFRYLDIRLGESGGKLVFYHGFCKCQEGFWPWSSALELGSVLKDCYSFLAANPSETIIFSVKMEQGDDVEAFQQLLDKYISEAEDNWLLTGEIPKLGDCRGKLVLFRRYEDAAGLGERAGIPMLWADQGANDDISLNASETRENGYILLVQDRYKYDSPDKWNAFTATLEASESIPADSICLNFLSSNGFPAYGHPYTYANTLNAQLLELDQDEIPGSAWIIVDFGNGRIADHILARHFVTGG